MFPWHSAIAWLLGHRLTTFEEEEGQSYHYGGDNQSQWEKNKLYLLLLIQETFTVEYNCTVTTHQRFLIPNHFNIFYSSLPLQLDRAGRTLLSLYKKAFKKIYYFCTHISNTPPHTRNRNCRSGQTLIFYMNTATNVYMSQSTLNPPTKDGNA